MNVFACPVCGYDRLRQHAEEWTICPCCGTEFGYEDLAPTREATERRWAELRWRWLEAGGPWFDPGTPRPPDWDPVEQVVGAPLGLEMAARETTATTEQTLAIDPGTKFVPVAVGAP